MELPAQSVAGQKRFYSEAFGWSFTSYGEDYAAHENDQCQFALNGSGHHQSDAALPVIRVEDITEAYKSVIDAGGEITVQIFEFPGGLRFHFNDPEGQAMAVYQPATE
ncbi:MAG: VOC family protein [Alteraurantiacibacter sp.]